MRFRQDDGEDLVYTAILNRYHVNVEFMEGEELRLDSRLDTINVVRGFLGAYPNAFYEVKPDEVSLFFEMLGSVAEAPDSYYQFQERFRVKRSDPDFWEISDYFNERFRRDHPLEAGLFDLNRYADDPRPPTSWEAFLFRKRWEGWMRSLFAFIF